MTSARAPCSFPTGSSSSQVLMTEMDPGSSGEKGPLTKRGWEGLALLLTIKMSAPLGSFLNQYLLFCEAEFKCSVIHQPGFFLPHLDEDSPINIW